MREIESRVMIVNKTNIVFHFCEAALVFTSKLVVFRFKNRGRNLPLSMRVIIQCTFGFCFSEADPSLIVNN